MILNSALVGGACLAGACYAGYVSPEQLTDKVTEAVEAGQGYFAQASGTSAHRVLACRLCTSAHLPVPHRRRPSLRHRRKVVRENLEEQSCAVQRGQAHARACWRRSVRRHPRLQAGLMQPTERLPQGEGGPVLACALGRARLETSVCVSCIRSALSPVHAFSTHTRTRVREENLGENTRPDGGPHQRARRCTPICMHVPAQEARARVTVPQRGGGSV
jgi:hypothetical protein